MDDQSLPPPYVVKYRSQTQATQATFNFILAFVAMKFDLSRAGKAALSDTELLLEASTDEQPKDFEDLKDFDKELKDSVEKLKELEKELKELDEMFGPCWASSDVPQECVYTITDLILECLKDEFFQDFEKKEEIEMMLGNSLSSEEFNELVDLSKKITDYVKYEDEMDEEEMDEDEMYEEDEAITP